MQVNDGVHATGVGVRKDAIELSLVGGLVVQVAIEMRGELSVSEARLSSSRDSRLALDSRDPSPEASRDTKVVDTCLAVKVSELAGRRGKRNSPDSYICCTSDSVTQSFQCSSKTSCVLAPRASLSESSDRQLLSPRRRGT